jgi:hypothetical protein
MGFLAITSSMCCSFQYCASASATWGRFGDTDPFELGERRADHRVQV